MALTRRLIVLVAAALVPLVGIMALNEYDLRRAREDEVRHSAMLRAQRMSGELAQIVEGVRSLLETLAETDEIKEQDPVTCLRVLRAVRARHKSFLALGATRADGGRLCVDRNNPDTPDEAATGTAADRSFFQRAASSRRFTVGNYAFGRLTQDHVIHFSAPYFDRSGGFAGVVFLAYSLDSLAHHFDAPNWGPDEAFSIVDSQGTILVRLPEFSRWVGKPFPPALWTIASEATEPGNYEVSSPLDGIKRIVGFVPPASGPGHLYIGVGMSRSAAFAMLDALTTRQVTLLAVVVALGILLAWFTGEWFIRRPVQALVTTADAMGRGDLQARSPISGKDELGRLGRALDGLAMSLDDAIRHKDVLLGEMAHRVMNTLAIVSGLFRAQSRQNEDPGVRRELEGAASRLNAVALAYRQMHRAPGESGNDIVDLGALLGSIGASLRDTLLAEGRVITVEACPASVSTNQATHLAILVNELATNAAKHGDDGPISILLGRSGDNWRLAVRNVGRLPPEYSVESAPGFGSKVLLSIAKTLGGRVEATTMGSETEFAVVFPVTQSDKGRSEENPRSCVVDLATRRDTASPRPPRT